MFFFYFLLGSAAGCQEGTFYDSVRGQCMDCDVVCKDCLLPSNDSSSNCVTCLNPMQVSQSGNCYYPCELTSNCEVCGLQCESCEDTSCVQCFPPYLLLRPGCTESCPAGYYQSSSECLECDKSCNGCYFNKFNCSTCASGFDKYKYSCIKTTCGDGIVTGAEQCDDAIDLNCFGCKIVNCLPGQFWNNSCVDCDMACQQCVGAGNTNCVTCSSGFNFVNGSCLLNVCGDGVKGGDEECDDDLETCQNCRVFQCQAPELVLSEYLEGFIGFRVLFSGTVLCGSCLVFSDYYLLGEAPSCQCLGHEMIVKFGTGFLFSYQSSLVINKNELSPCSKEYKIILSGSDNRFALSLVSTSLTLCSAALSMSSQIVSSGNLKIISFVWTVYPSNDEVSKYLMNLNPTIPAHLLHGNSFEFDLEVQNFLGDRRRARIQEDFTDISNIAIISKNELTVSRQFENLVRVELDFCEDPGLVFFDWQVLSGNLTSVKNFGRIGQVLNDCFDKSDFIELKVTAWSNVSSKVQKKIRIAYGAAEIEAVIDKKCVQTSGEVVKLSGGKSSYAGLNTGLSYFWTVFCEGKVVQTGNKAEFNVSISGGKEYEVNLIVNNSEFFDLDKSSIKSSDLEFWISSDSYKIKQGSSLYFTKANYEAKWASNLNTRSSKHSVYTRFREDWPIGSPWVGIENLCVIPVKSPKSPVVGSIALFPKTGVAWDTEFQISAVNWFYCQLFQYFYSVNGEYVAITDLVDSDKLTTTLPYSKNLKVKIRGFTLNRDYVEQEITVFIENNGGSLEGIFYNIINKVQVTDYEKYLRASVLFLPLIQLRSSEALKIDKGSADSDLESVLGKILTITLIASGNLPVSQELNLMVLRVLNEILTYKTIDNSILPILYTVRSRYCRSVNEEIVKNTIGILNNLLELSSSSNSFLNSEAENIIMKIAMTLAQTQAFEPAYQISTNNFFILSVKIPQNYSYQDPSLYVTAKETTNLAILFLENPTLQNLYNASVIIHSDSSQLFSGIVLLDNYNSSYHYKCDYQLYTEDSSILNNSVFCPFNGSTKISLKKNENSIESSRIDFSKILFVVIFYSFVFALLVFGLIQDRKDMNLIYPEPSLPVSSSFLSSFKNCHVILNIFTRFSQATPRPIRVFIVSIRLQSMIIPLILCKPYIPVVPLIIFSVFISLLIGKTSFLLKKREIRTIKAIQNPPDLRYSPSINLPELSEKVKYSKYSNNRNYSEVNPVNDTNFTYEIKYLYSKRLVLIGCLIGVGIFVITCRWILISSFDWWGLFLVSVGIDFIGIQLFLISVQFFVLRRFKIFKNIISKTMNDSTEVNISNFSLGS